MTLKEIIMAYYENHSTFDLIDDYISLQDDEYHEVMEEIVGDLLRSRLNRIDDYFSFNQ